MSFMSMEDIKRANRIKEQEEQPAMYQCLNCGRWFSTGYSESFCCEDCCIAWLDDYESYYLGQK